jgi:hypothetical protein
LIGKGMYEVPLHIFKKDGAAVTSSTDLMEFKGRFVYVTVIGRYKFNGISLSNLGAINLRRRTHEETKPGSGSLGADVRMLTHNETVVKGGPCRHP